MDFLLVLAVLPVYLLCIYIYKKDKEKEPKQLLRKLFLFGMLSTIFVIIIELILGIFFNINNNSNMIFQFVSILISVGLVEEMSKWIILKLVAFNNKEFNHIYDMIVYSVFTSLGFAIVENILYVVSTGIATGIIRALISVPGHACFAIFMGYYLGIAKINKVNNLNNKYNKNIFLSIVSPVLIHTIFDFLLLSQNIIFIVIFFIFLIIIYIICIKKINTLANVSEDFKEKVYNKYCIKCGNSLNGRYCNKCGLDNSN